MKPFTRADIATMRFMRSKGQGAALIGQTFGARTMNELLDRILVLIPEEEEAQRPADLLFVLPVGAAEAAELVASRHCIEVDRPARPPGRQPGEQAALIRDLKAAGRSAREIADLLGCQAQTVHAIACQDRKRSRETAPPGAPAPSAAPARIARPGSALDLAAQVEEALRAGTVKVTRCPTACAAPTAGVELPPEDAAAMRRRHDALTDRHWSWRGLKSAAASTTTRSTPL